MIKQLSESKKLKKITMAAATVAMGIGLVTSLSSFDEVGGSGCGTYNKDGLTGTENFAELESANIPQYSVVVEAEGFITVAGKKVKVAGVEGQIAIGSGGYTKECDDALFTSCNLANEGYLIYCPTAYQTSGS